MSYKVKLNVFEGPFDLLVYLIENAKMSIYDIRVSEITQQYMEYIREMKDMDFNVSAEFMVLAATLIDIKARMILPRNADPETGEIYEDPRSELVERILEYKRFKERAELLGERFEYNSLIFEKPQEDISEYTDNPDEMLSLGIDQFVTAFKLFLQREKRVSDVRAHYTKIDREKATTEGRIAFIANKLKSALMHGLKKLSFKELIPDIRSRYDVAVSFASVLQMMKDKRIDAEQKSNYAEIFITPPKKDKITKGKEETGDVQ